MAGYSVGYGKPPKRSRFQKGQSGNPRGRPKQARNFKTEVRQALDTRVRITKDGVQKKVPALRAVLMLLIDKALKGDAKAWGHLLSLARTWGDIQEDQPKLDLKLLTDEELEIMRQAALIMEKYAPTGAADDDPATNDRRRITRVKREPRSEP